MYKCVYIYIYKMCIYIYKYIPHISSCFRTCFATHVLYGAGQTPGTKKSCRNNECPQNMSNVTKPARANVQRKIGSV